MSHIPFNKPYITGREFTYIREALSRNHLSADGIFTSRCQDLMSKKLKVKRVYMMNSCTAALEAAALLTRVGPGDEVILPSFTFPSTANAFLLRGARLKFAEIDPISLNIDPASLDKVRSKRTKVVVPVHYAGVPCEMNAIEAWSRKYHVEIVEDAAQALGAFYQGKPVGSLGHLAAFSFHETKNIHCGEGGALAVDNPAFLKRAMILRQKGTNRDDFKKGVTRFYWWVDIGSSYAPSELQMAFLYPQLMMLEQAIAKRKALHLNYMKVLSPLANKGDIELPFIPLHIQSSYHLFQIRLPNKTVKDRVLRKLQLHGVDAIIHYFPLHLSPMGRRAGYRNGDLPVTENTFDRLIRLPFFTSMKPTEQERIAAILNKCLS